MPHAHLFKTARRQMRKIRHRGASTDKERQLVAAADEQRAQGLGWRYDGFRGWSDAQVFEALARVGLSLDDASFRREAAEHGSPTNLGEKWLSRAQAEGKWRDLPMLAARELWRRLLADRPTAETVADDVDELLEEAEVAAGRTDLWLRAARRLVQGCGADREFFDRVVRESGSDLAGWMVAAPAALLGTPDEGEAPALYEAFARLHDEKAMRAERAEVLARLKRGTEAVAEIEKLLARFGGDPLVLLKAGAVHEALGNLPQAQDFFRRYEEARKAPSAKATMAAAAKSGVDLPPMDLRNVGRNDLCPCGSGKKFKKCHGMLS